MDLWAETEAAISCLSLILILVLPDVFREQHVKSNLPGIIDLAVVQRAHKRLFPGQVLTGLVEESLVFLMRIDVRHGQLKSYL